MPLPAIAGILGRLGLSAAARGIASQGVRGMAVKAARAAPRGSTRRSALQGLGKAAKQIHLTSKTEVARSVYNQTFNDRSQKNSQTSSKTTNNNTQHHTHHVAPPPDQVTPNTKPLDDPRRKREPSSKKMSSATKWALALAIPTLGLSLLAAGLKTAAQATLSWTTKMSESQRRLTQYNGQIANSFALLEANRVGRGIQSGAATAESTQGLNDSINRLENAMLPFEDVATNFWNGVGTTTNNFTASILEELKSIAVHIPFYGDALKKAAEEAKNDGAEGVMQALFKKAHEKPEKPKKRKVGIGK